MAQQAFQLNNPAVLDRAAPNGQVLEWPLCARLFISRPRIEQASYRLTPISSCPQKFVAKVILRPRWAALLIP